MKPLRVLLACRDSPRSRGGRMIGHWSYPVPEFTWDILTVPRFFTIDLAPYYGQYDLVVHEDNKAWGKFVGDHKRLPVAYICRDSTLSLDHYTNRFAQARNYADLVLVDWDELGRFTLTGKPVRRFSHCVNDRMFYDYGEPKTVDVAFHASIKGFRDRVELREWTWDYCKRKGYTYAYGLRDYIDYAQSFSRAKVTLHLERTPTTRAHRVFDAMACKTCLLTSPLPDVSGEHRTAGEDYVEWRNYGELEVKLDKLLAGEWERYAEAGYHLVHSEHTWRIRARELRVILGEVFPQLRGRNEA